MGGAMREICNFIDDLAHTEGETAYRFCLLLTGSPRRAEQAAFQGFLYLAELKDAPSTEDARLLLYRFLYRASEDAWYRRGSAPLKRAAFEELAGAAVSDDLWRLVKRPLKRKAAVFLAAGACFSAEEAARALGTRRERVEKWLAGEAGAQALCAELADAAPSGAWAEQLGDDLLMRWQERNVPLENKLLRIRSAADRLAPILALAAVLLCLAAVWYTARLSASLGG